jgi:hypothetical protein
MPYTFVGPNFLGKLHNTKQHIQFLRYIKGDIVIPDDILESFLTVYSDKFQALCSDKDEIPEKLRALKHEFDTCSVFVFEICSLNLYERDGFQVQKEFTNSFSVTSQSQEDLLSDLKIIIGMIPEGKRIVFEGHFRLDYIFGDADKKIQNRDVILDTLQKLRESGEFPNVRVYDPSVILRENPMLFVDTHFTDTGHEQSLIHMFDNFMADLAESKP